MGGWVQVSLGQRKLLENRPKIPAQMFWSSIPCVFCLYRLSKVVNYYDLSVLSMSVVGFKKNSLDGGG